MRQMVAPHQIWPGAGNPESEPDSCPDGPEPGFTDPENVQVTETGSVVVGACFFFVSQISIATAAGPTMASA